MLILITGCWDQKQILPYLDQERRLIRPGNFAPDCPGRGDVRVETESGPVVVATVIGRVFMPPVDCPFRSIDATLRDLANPPPVILVEIPTDKEIHDNIVAFWRPEAALTPGQSHRFAYSLSWTLDPPPGDTPILQSRSGREHDQPGARRYVIQPFVPKDDLPDPRYRTKRRTSPDRLGAVADLMRMMTEHRIRHLPVVEANVLCGIISIGDIVKNRVDELHHEADAMREYIRTG